MANQLPRPDSPVSVTGFGESVPVSVNPSRVFDKAKETTNTRGDVVGQSGPSTGRQGGVSPSPVPVGSMGRAPGGSSTADRALANQSRLAKRAPKSLVTAAGGIFAGYVPTKTRVQYSDNKVGIMPDIGKVVEEIAESAGVDVTDVVVANKFLEALVVDVYVNPYSDKQTFDGNLVIDDFQLPRVHIRNVITKYVGTNHRRFARAMAPLVIQAMHDNYETFGDILDKRMTELNLGTRAEAVNMFDGADALVSVDRAAAQKNALHKALALTARSSHRAYGTGNSAAAAGDHRNERSPELDSA